LNLWITFIMLRYHPWDGLKTDASSFKTWAIIITRYGEKLDIRTWSKTRIGACSEIVVAHGTGLAGTCPLLGYSCWRFIQKKEKYLDAFMQGTSLLMIKYTLLCNRRSISCNPCGLAE